MRVLSSDTPRVWAYDAFRAGKVFELPARRRTRASLRLILHCVCSSIILLGWALAAANIYAGRYLTRREKYTFCLVVAAVNCANTPIGTILGVFTIVVLMRPSVKQMFEASRAAQQSPSVKPQCPD